MSKDSKIQEIISSDHFTKIDDAYCFLGGDRRPLKTAGDRLLGRIQNFLKANGKLYSFLLMLFGPVVVATGYRRAMNRLLNEYGDDRVILNLGSGPYSPESRDDIINVDIYSFDEVDIVADAGDLPVKDESADLIFNLALLEHVEEPGKVIDEMYRVLRKGGKTFCYLPFIVPFHAAPSDYHRWTYTGARRAFDKFTNIETGIGVGPASGLLWVLQEWISILLSFGIRPVHDILFLLIMLLTFPVKYLDFLMVKLPYAENISSGFYVIAEK